MSDPPRLTRAEQRKRTAATVIDAVAALIEERGHFTIADVAERSGVSPATIYRHYPDRAALLHAASTSYGFKPEKDPTSLAEYRDRLVELYGWMDQNYEHVVATASTPAGREMRAQRMRAREPLMHEIMARDGIDPASDAGQRLLLLWHSSSRLFLEFREIAGLGPDEAAEVAGWAISALWRATQEGWEIDDELD